MEAASIALGLRLTKPWLWNRLDDGVRQRVAAWLSGVLGEPPVNNNWWLFPLTVGGFLADAGVEEEASRAAIQRGLERIEGWYAGGGWYTDGPERSFDHYNRLSTRTGLRGVSGMAPISAPGIHPRSATWWPLAGSATRRSASM